MNITTMRKKLYAALIIVTLVLSGCDDNTSIDCTIDGSACNNARPDGITALSNALDVNK